MKAAIIYSHKATKTSQVAKQIKEKISITNLTDMDVEQLEVDALKSFDLLIMGAPSWFDGELPNYWDELVPAIEDLTLTSKKVAIFGNGDQIGYPENFADAIGLLAEVFESTGAIIIGHTSIDGYVFEKSKAQRGDAFCGLVLDFENQHSQNSERISKWVENIDNQLNKL